MAVWLQDHYLCSKRALSNSRHSCYISIPWSSSYVPILFLAFYLSKQKLPFLKTNICPKADQMCFFPPTMPLRILRPWRSTVFPPVCYGHHPPSRFCPCPPPIVGKHNPRAQMDWRQLVWSEHSKPAVRWAANSRQHFEVEVWCPASLVSFCTYCWLLAAARNINTLPATRCIAQMDCPWVWCTLLESQHWFSANSVDLSSVRRRKTKLKQMWPDFWCSHQGVPTKAPFDAGRHQNWEEGCNLCVWCIIHHV